MTDPTGIAGAIAAVKSALELATALRGADSVLAQADLKMRIGDLVDALVNAKMGIAEAQVEIFGLRKQVADLEEQRRVRASVEYRGGLYWTVLPTGKEDGQYCTACYDTKGHLVRAKDAGNDWIHCPVCSHGVDGPNGGPNRRLRDGGNMGLEF